MMYLGICIKVLRSKDAARHNKVTLVKHTMNTLVLLGIIFYLIASVHCEEQAFELEEECKITYPDFIKLEEESSYHYPYLIDGNIPVFKKVQFFSDTDMNDYTVAVFYGDEEENIEAVYVLLVDHNLNNADMRTYYIQWQRETPHDSTTSMSGSGQLKSIKCHILTQKGLLSCKFIENIMKYTYKEHKNIISTWKATEHSVELGVECKVIYPHFIKLGEVSSQNLRYLMGEVIPVFEKISSEANTYDHTVAVFYGDEEETIEAIYVLVSSNYNNANAPTYYIEWRSELSADSIISMSQSGKLKSIKCQILAQVESQIISCMPVEEIMKYTYNKDENIIKKWEGTEVPSIENYLKKFAIRSAVLFNSRYLSQQGIEIDGLNSFFYYVSGKVASIETRKIAVHNVKRITREYYPLPELCSHARELLNQIEENVRFESNIKSSSLGMANSLIVSVEVETAKDTLVSFGISEEKLVDAETKPELIEKLNVIVPSITNTEFKLHADVFNTHCKNMRNILISALVICNLVAVVKGSGNG